MKAAGDNYNKQFINGFTEQDWAEAWDDGDKFFSNYSSIQKAINRRYNTYAKGINKYDDTHMYVFILPEDKTRKPGQLGDMPLGEQWGYLFVNNFGEEADKQKHYRTLSHELGHGRTALPHTFKDDYIAKYSTNNLMDYVDPGSFPPNGGSGWEGALVRAQWDMVHNPAIFTPLQSDADGATRSKNEKFFDLVQRIRCAYGSNKNSIYVPFQTNLTEQFTNVSLGNFSMIKARFEWDEKWEWKDKPEYINLPASLPTPTPGFIWEARVKALTYNFGDIRIMIPEMDKTKFEQLIGNSNFQSEYQVLSSLIQANEMSAAIKTLLNFSYCVYEKLNLSQRKILLKALAEKFILSEEYEDMVINLIRSSNLGLEDKGEQKTLLSYILQTTISPTIVSKILIMEREPSTIFECFANNIHNFGGKANYYTFIVEMSKLFNSAYSAEILDAYDPTKCTVVFNWTIQGSEKLVATQGDILINKLRFHGYYYNTCHLSLGNYFEPGKIILVNFGREFSFINGTDERMVAMPAFVLKYIIDYEVKAQEINFIDNLMTIFSFAKAIKGLALIGDASKLEKIKIAWDVVKTTLGFVLKQEDVRQSIKNTGSNGTKFLEYWDRFQELDALAGGVSGITKVFNNETFYMFTEMNAAWDVLSLDPNLKIDKEIITKEINDLKTLFSDEGIVY